MDRGRFISVEGIEGVGKSTNIEVLVRCIEEAGHRVLTTREPGGTPLAEDIRHIVQHRGDEPVPEIAELLLIFAARSLNVNNVIIPALEAGTWVVSDRFTDSSRAYQGGGRGIPLETIETRAGTWAPRRSEPVNVDIIAHAVEEIVLVSDEEMAHAARWLWQEMGVAARSWPARSSTRQGSGSATRRVSKGRRETPARPVHRARVATPERPDRRARAATPARPDPRATSA